MDPAIVDGGGLVDGIGFALDAGVVLGIAMALELAAAIAVGTAAAESIGAGIADGSDVIAFGVAATCGEVEGDATCRIIARRSGRLYAKAPPPKSNASTQTPPMKNGTALRFAGDGPIECCG